ncbi:MAG: hypothetical protein ABIU05_05750 [Nitrospirales bacterium]
MPNFHSWPGAAFRGPNSSDLARIIHEGFYCTRRYAATTGLTAGGLVAQSVTILFQVCLLPSRLRAPVSHGVSAVSSRILVNNVGCAYRAGSEAYNTW